MGNVDEVQDIDLLQPVVGFECHAKKFAFCPAENWKPSGVIKQRIISIFFFRKITGCCVEDGQQEGKTDGTDKSVETCANGHHA